MYNRNKQYIYHTNRQVPTICTNCNMPGHSYKYCLAPVNSYGIIAFRVKDVSWTLSKGLISNNGKNLNGIDSVMQNVEFLLIQRKDSLRFVDFVRGKYNVTDPDYLKQMLSNMTIEEREFLKTTTFENLWKRVWGSASARNYKNDYDLSKQRFDAITERDASGANMLEKIRAETTTTWTQPEWGFPKGRRNPGETDMKCAIREFEEETGIMENNIKVVQNMEPLLETFYGDNHVHYCHKYFLAQIPIDVDYSPIETNMHMSREIGDIGWFSIDDALTRIRSENVEKREILLRVSGLIRSYCFGSFL